MVISQIKWVLDSAEWYYQSLSDRSRTDLHIGLGIVIVFLLVFSVVCLFQQ